MTFCEGRRIVRPGAAVADRGEVFGYTIEQVVAATGHEAAQFKLPDDCVILLA